MGVIRVAIDRGSYFLLLYILESCEELHRSVLFDVTNWVLVRLKKFSASSLTFIYFRYHSLWYITAINLSIPTDCISCSVSLILMGVQYCERFKIPFFQKSKKNRYARYRIRRYGDDSEWYQARLGAQQYLIDITRNVEINIEEARLAKRNIFTDIAVRHLG